MSTLSVCRDGVAGWRHPRSFPIRRGVPDLHEIRSRVTASPHRRIRHEPTEPSESCAAMPAAHGTFAVDGDPAARRSDEVRRSRPPAKSVFASPGVTLSAIARRRILFARDPVETKTAVEKTPPGGSAAASLEGRHASRRGQEPPSFSARRSGAARCGPSIANDNDRRGSRQRPILIGPITGRRSRS